MGVIICFLFVFFVSLPFCRFIFVNFPRILIGGIKDLYKYIKYKRWNECRSYGRIVCYTGLFGMGKTKECVRYVIEQFKRYEGKMIYDFDSQKWIQQHIVVISNVHLEIPYEPLTSLQQLVDCQQRSLDARGCVFLFIVDEASVVFNSREFKSNFSTPALNTILTSRHHKIAIFLTAQRFNHLDALLRQVTSYVYECSFFVPLRIQKISVYDAWDVENCSNILLLKPLRVLYSYTLDAYYALYDTFSMVHELSKKCTSGDFYSDVDILSRQGTSGDVTQINRAKGKLKKRIEK